MHNFAYIRHALAARPPHLLSDPQRSLSAVALILGEEHSEPQILFIRRASRHDDPWSGDLAFPGGRIEATDRNAQAAAEREVREEIGLHLQTEQFVGRLDDIAGAHLPVIVSCFVYQIGHPVTLTLSDEVAQTFWIPLSRIADARRHGPATVSFNGQTFSRPAIDLLGPGHRVLWGITYRLVMNFLDRLSHLPGSRSVQRNGAP